MRSKISGGELGGITNLAVLAPVKSGFIDGFETMTYVERLRRLLDALNAARLNLREASLFKPPFPDSIGRFGIIHSFRYVIVPPAAADPLADPGPHRLSLNVTFDGGWEPYMRVIYRDIGTLLDALFCHCDGYPGSRTSSFDTYCRWVRANELPAGLFYDDSPMSLGDQHYLERIERIQRETADAAEADRRIAAFAVAPEAAQQSDAFRTALLDPLPALAISIRALKGLYRLSPLFPTPAERDILLRFAGEALQDFHRLISLPAFRASPGGRAVAAAVQDELAWFGNAPLSTPSAPPAPLPKPDPYELQAGIVAKDETTTHGCLVLLRVAAADAALKTLKALPVSRHGKRDAGGIRRSVAFTYTGLLALGLPAERLDALPQEFMDGMEARAGLLGDVRGNHPDFWARPARCDADLQPDPNDRVDLSTVHVVVILRLADAVRPDADLHPQLAAEVARLMPATSGFQVLAVQPTRSRRVPNPVGKGTVTREHFGFVDGISQPGLQGTPDLLARDEIATGDLFLGYVNGRGDAAEPPPENVLLHNGTFLVVRKMRQHVDRLQGTLDRHVERSGLAGATAAAQRAALLAKMMGRTQDGVPLVPGAGGPTQNDFDYASDGEGRGCPFSAHVRRANPRDGRPAMPRILRRGMSYGPSTDEAGANVERGIVFMAYCASIAEQFEIIQRWIAGGNSSGVSSAQADPFLAVPQPGEPRTLRYFDADGRVARADLGADAFVTLEWGLYLFVPSLKALDALDSLRQPVVTRAIATPINGGPAADPLDAWRSRLEDPDPASRGRLQAIWAAVRAQPDGRFAAPPYGTLVGRQADVLAVLQDNGAKYSVRGYGERMGESIGLNYLGMDGGAHARLAPTVNAAIVAIDEAKAFAAAAPWVVRALSAAMPLQQANPDGSFRIPVDVIALAEKVLAGLCTEWVGLPERDQDVPSGEARFMAVGGRVDGDPLPPRCPGNLLTTSHYVFTPHPKPGTTDAGRAQGSAALKAVKELLASTRPLGELALAIQAGLQAIGASVDDLERSISGVLLGFPPTVYGNFLRTMETWIDDKTLWDNQRALADVPAAVGDPYDRARDALRKPLMATMRQRPVPEMLWRCPVVGGKAVGAVDGASDDQRLVLGIASALADEGAPDEMMFGGSRDSRSAVATEHACPGYGMGVGVLLSLFAGLFGAGTLRPTGSPVLLMLTPRADWLTRAAELLRQDATS